ncbi:presilphiperfolan-8-beta-ol synthase [Aspergillus udagawae]|uniref:Terpene synthase n=1 Tax=Aspergillus udagawae TaxID=91492 RepID=A0ABQ1A7P6_9EURO|nr:presilphiperfolan-8-beta-ol synthase [Aspergillus udagawae]GFF75513.1 presilphiperfolan-8-beta-ol synthase [Aspergillus udagawae]GFG01683.1 presilphiperfolan-8-beta-ol synthase [Aspergillus udagawae]GFG24316.1 presilphiperfolan-8-beta-ol synthase [Aspergillus udagawae]
MTDFLVHEHLVRPGEKRTPTQDTHIPVHLPQLFVLFLSENTVVNPHYEEVRKESEEWLANECSFDERSRRILSKTDFSYFCSVAAPDAGPEELRTVCDWGNWVFPFDDMFDNGGLKDNPARAQQLIDSLLAGMREEYAQLPSGGYSPLVRVHNTVWQRVAQASPVGVRRRFAASMGEYCKGSIEQVHMCSTGRYPSLDEMLALRRQSAGVAPLFALVEYAHKLDIPDHVFECRSIKEIERIGVDLVLLQNDILSYCKEEKEGVTHNVVAICRHSGMPAQMAFNYIGNMLVARYRDWYLALAELPSWGEHVDAQVQQYIRGVQNVVMANLNWSFRSGRYFGDAKDIVRKSMVVRVKRQSADV